MARRLLRGVRHLLGALVLLTGLVCLTEVGLSARRASLRAEARVATVADLSVPSRVAFREMRPLSRTSPEAGPLVRTNSFGLRGPEPAAPKAAGVFRVLVLGGEATLAAGTPESQTFCAVAQTLLEGRTAAPVEVLNAGVPGGCPLTLGLLLRHRLAALSPDAVVFMLDAGDVADDLRCRPFLRQDAEGRPLACEHPAAGGRRGTADAWRSEFCLVDLAGRYLTDRWVRHSPPVRDDLLSGSRRTEWLGGPAAEWAGPLAAALAPVAAAAASRPAVAVVVPDAGGPAAGWAEAAVVLSAGGVRLIDPGGAFAQMGEAAGLFREDPAAGDRLSARGHQRMGLELAAAIAQLPGVR